MYWYLSLCCFILFPTTTKAELEESHKVTKETVIYLGAPYNHSEKEVRQRRLRVVTWLTTQMHQKGLFVLSPLTHNVPLVDMGLKSGWQQWKKWDEALLSRCDKLLILKLPGWEQSTGLRGEIEYAQAHGIPIEYCEVSQEEIDEAIAAYETAISYGDTGL